MIPKECKRLAEVDFPIAEVSLQAAREKSIRSGHPSTIHLWWARRPLASSRAMLLSLLLPDPCDPGCPEDFRAKARATMLNLPSRPTRWDAQLLTETGLQQALLQFIADFANWDNAAKPAYVTAGRSLVHAAHPDEIPLVVDPFAGGGSVPMEALRLGCDTFASDLNPVACLILKILLEDIPRHGPGPAHELRKAGTEIKTQAEKELADLYPKDPDGSTPIAYVWARTVRCESPNCGAEIPLIRSFWLRKKSEPKWALRPSVIRDVSARPKVRFEIFSPTADAEVASGTVNRARATCPCCQSVMSPARVRSQLATQIGGGDVVFDERGNRTGGARLTAVVTLKRGQQGRHYRTPTSADYAAVHKAQGRVTSILADWEREGKQGLCPVPDEPLPSTRLKGNSGFRVLLYGMKTWGDLFTARQKATLMTLVRLVSDRKCPPEVRTALALSVSRFADISNSLCRWESSRAQVRNLFARQAIPMIWDFGEASFFGGQAGDYATTLDTMIRVIERWNGNTKVGLVQSADATEHPLPDESAQVWFTDPPYYDAIHYADLADFFLVWLKRTLPDYQPLRETFDSGALSQHKDREAVQDLAYRLNGRVKDSAFFEDKMREAFAEGRRVLSEEGVASVVFAHKSTEGWEALLSGMIRGGWTITGSWPIATESTTRPNARETASLATSVHLVCRPRPEDAPVGDWTDVLRELPVRVGEWMERLQAEGVRGADLVFACVGPALEIFSRHSSVETAAGDAVTLPEYLERVWEAVGRLALEQVLGTAEAQARNGTAGVLEEDARLTALFLWTRQSSGDESTESHDEPTDADDETDDGDSNTSKKKGYRLPFDVARRFAQPLGIHLDEWRSRIIDIEKGAVRLLPVSERRNQLLDGDENAPLLDQIEDPGTASSQLSLFPDQQAPRRSGSQRVQALQAMEQEPAGLRAGQRSLTTLDRVHIAMLYQASGRSSALRAFLQSEQERGTYFVRLANALSALYPSGSSEKRLLDAMLLAMPR